MSNIYIPGLISQKYDPSLDYHISMYDQLPYKRDEDYCNAQKLALYSGSIVKYYLCANSQNTFEIDNHDSEIRQILATIEANSTIKPSADEIETITEPEDNGITQEQIQTLLDDLDEQDLNPDLDAKPVEAPTINAFEGVEDW